jgi:hypothetical protein
VASRSLAVSDTSLVVRRGDEVVGSILWSDVDSVHLDLGDGLLRVAVDVLADTTDSRTSTRGPPTSGTWDTDCRRCSHCSRPRSTACGRSWPPPARRGRSRSPRARRRHSTRAIRHAHHAPGTSSPVG